MDQSEREFSMHRGAIAGAITDAHGVPVANAAVMIVGDSPAHLDIAPLTNDQGAYRLDTLLPGVYTLLVNAAHYAPQTKHIEVFSGMTARLDFRLLD